ncbi:hypothetical protein [Mesoterricola silvestris]|uniref:hypothetical protein n=1 Tax=Mesoterricola silvestris TaxID=2927979 RepID=UPI00292D226E|nr:hypothetical protein [Mesoterricola silvestris]
MLFDPLMDVWEFQTSSKTIRLKFAPLRAWATDEMVASIKAAMVGVLRAFACSSSATLMEKAVGPLLKHAYSRRGKRVDSLTLDMIQAFALSLDERHRNQLAFVKMFAKALALHGDPGHRFSPEAQKWVAKLRHLETIKGEATLTMHPTKGPLLLSEDRILMRALHDSWETNLIPAHAYLKILLFRLSGMRRAQVADLKCKDLNQKDGVYTLAFPQVKRPGEGWRESFESWALHPEVGALLAGWIADQKAKWAHLGMGDDLPLFVHPENQDPIRTYHYVGESLVAGLPRVLGGLMVFDSTTRTLVRLRSPRTGDYFKISMKRFRMSLATWALLRGATLIQVARILGHTTVSSALECYGGIDVKVLMDADRKMAASEVRTAGYFKGELCYSGQGSALYPESFQGRAIGQCKNLCAQRKPYACYTCLKFQALMAGPHEQVLKELEAERDQVLVCGGTSQADTHDMSIQAVKQVIAMRDNKLRRDGLSLELLLEQEGM